MPPKVGSSAAMTSTSGRHHGRRFRCRNVDAGEFLEQDRLALHHRLGGERADIAEAQHRGAVGDDGDEIPRGGVIGGLAGIGRDRLAGAATPGE